ncbi:hypothetical protein ACE6H2_012818 [Prunus campanulata]
MRISLLLATVKLYRGCVGVWARSGISMMEEDLGFVYSWHCLDFAMAKACWHFVEGELEFGMLPAVGKLGVLPAAVRI